MKRSFLLNLPYYLAKPPGLLWSRGWYGVADETGDGSIFYRAQRTERRVRTLTNLVGKSGVIWLRLGSSAWHKGRASDTIIFAEQVISRLGGETVLVTTDGDLSVPSDLPNDVTEKILGDKNIVAWFTQNYDGSVSDPKLRPIPVGLDLHTGPNGTSISPAKKAKWYKKAQQNQLPLTTRVSRIWSDVHFKSNPGKHGDPRGEIQGPILSGELSSTVDAPSSRLSHREIWDRYNSYMFVLSLPGSAVEAHRTWEALALGAIVITVHTSLDQLLKPYRVVFLDQTEKNWWRCLGDTQWIEEASRLGGSGRLLDLSWKYWNDVVRSPLEG